MASFFSFFHIDQESFYAWFSIHKKEVVGGVFFLFMLLIGNYTIFASVGPSLPERIRLPVLIPTAEGLIKSSPVFSHGVRVGYVYSLTTVGLDKQGKPLSFKQNKPGAVYGQGIIAILSLSRDFLFYPNYRIVTRHHTILSEKFIEVLPGYAAKWEKPLPGYRHPWPENTTNERPVDVLNLSFKEVQKFHQTGVMPQRDFLLNMSNYDDPLYLIASVIYENRNNLRHIFINLEDITSKINRGKGTASALINQKKLAIQLNKVLEESIYFTRTVRDGVESIRESNGVVELIGVAITFGFWWWFGGPGSENL